MNLTRITSTLGAGAVAGIAAWSSWSHMVHVAMHVGERAEVAYVLPLSVDGLLVVSAAAMADDKRNGQVPRLSARIAFGVGVAATIAANIASAQPSTSARIVAAWPAVALLLVVELLSRRGRHRAAIAPLPAPSVEPAEPADTASGPPVPPTRPRVTRRPESAAKVARAAAKMPGATAAQIAARAGVSESTARRYLPAPDAATLPPPNNAQPAATP